METSTKSIPSMTEKDFQRIKDIKNKLQKDNKALLQKSATMDPKRAQKKGKKGRNKVNNRILVPAGMWTESLYTKEQPVVLEKVHTDEPAPSMKTTIPYAWVSQENVQYITPILYILAV